MLDELEASKQSRLRAWNGLQRLRSVLFEAGNVAIQLPAKKTFDAEGEALEHALTKSFRIRNDSNFFAHPLPKEVSLLCKMVGYTFYTRFKLGSFRWFWNR